MKIRFFFTAILALSFGLLSAQSPQGVNYQAVVRDGSGNILSDQEIELVLSVLDDELNVVWKESHEETTNSFGLVSVVLGQGTYVSGTETEFADIEWGDGSYSLKTEVVYDGGSPINMGTSPILSVPYALEAVHAQSADTYSGVSRTNQLLVDGVTENVEESLFEVKNVDGQTVFAVYNEGVQIFVSDGDAKGVKGGFAVKGFGSSKAEPIDLLLISADSTRLYVGTNEAKGVKGGFAVKGFGNSKAEPIDLLVVSSDSTRLYIGANEAKGVKGGFAVKGFGGDKGDENDLLVVDSDSTRIYIGTNESKGVKGGFAVGSFSGVSKGGNEEYFRVTRDSTRIYVQTDEQGNMLGGFAVQATTTDKVTGQSINTEFFSVARDTANNTALGFGTIANQPYETVIGLYNDTTSFEWAERLFTIGDGTSPEDRSNALVILKNGKMGIGVTELSRDKLYNYGLVIESDGVYISGPGYSEQQALPKGDTKAMTTVTIEGGLQANGISLSPAYDEYENYLYPPALYVDGGYMYGGSLDLTGAYNMESGYYDSPYLNVSGGSINGGSLDLNGVYDPYTEAYNPPYLNMYGGIINGGSIELNGVLNPEIEGYDPPYLNVNGGTVNSLYINADTINTQFVSVDTIVSPAYILKGNSYKFADAGYIYSEPSGISDVLYSMMNISAYDFEWSPDYPELPQGNNQYGLFAQDLEYYFPQVVKTIDGVKMVDYDQVVALLWQAVVDLMYYSGYGMK